MLVLKVNPHSVAGSQPLPPQPFPPQLIKSARLLSEEKLGCLLRLQNVKGSHGLKTCWQGIARAYVYEAGAARPPPPPRPAAAAAPAAANCLPDRHLTELHVPGEPWLSPEGDHSSAHKYPGPRDCFTKRNLKGRGRKSTQTLLLHHRVGSPLEDPEGAASPSLSFSPSPRVCVRILLLLGRSAWLIVIFFFPHRVRREMDLFIL